MVRDRDNKTIEELTKKKTGIHAGHRERLRNKINFDPEFKTFADHEILEYILSLVIPRRDTNKLAHELIDHFGSLASVFYVAPSQLIKFKGMTVSASYLLPALMPLARRVILMSRSEYRKGSMDVPSELLNHMQSFFIGRRTEMFMLFLFDSHYKLITHHTYQNSSPTEVIVPIEDAVYRALNEGASYVAIAHNHPVGDVSISDADMNLTIKLNHALSLSGIKLIEHAIFYENKVFSFHNSGIMDKIVSDFIEVTGKTKLSDSKPERKVFLHDLMEHVLMMDSETPGILQANSKFDAMLEYLERNSIDYFKSRLEEARNTDPGSDTELMWNEFYHLKQSMTDIKGKADSELKILRPRLSDFDSAEDMTIFEDDSDYLVFPLPDTPQKYKGTKTKAVKKEKELTVDDEEYKTFLENLEFDDTEYPDDF